MRLTRFGLRNYGNFAELDLAFEPRPGCIEVLAAPNGAGKSVLRQAICELLFGVQPRTQMGFRFGYPRMRLRAEAIEAGETFGFVRRKGDVNTLTDLAGAPADAKLAGRLPHDRDRVRLERLFALDSAQLVAGGEALLRSGGDLADALLSGAGELRPAREIVANLAAQRDAIAPRRKKASAAFHEAGEALREAQVRLAAALVRPQDWAEREQKRDDAVARRAKANDGAAAARMAAARLQRVRSTRRHLEALDGASGWLAANPDAPVLPPGLAERLATARQEAAAAQAEHAAQQRRLAELSRECADIPIDDAVLARTDAIAALAEERGRARQSRLDIPPVTSDLDAAHATAAGLLRQIGSPCDPADAGRALRSVADIEVARRLILRHAGLEAAVAGGPAVTARLRRSIADTGAALAGLPPQTQTEAVEALAAEITADGQPVASTERAGRAAGEAAEALQAALARVPRWTGDAAALIAVAAPAEAEFARLDAAMQAAANGAQQASKERDRATASLRKQQRLLAEQEASGPLPDHAAVLKARAYRDKGWRMIHDIMRNNLVDEAALQAFAAGDDLSLVYAAAVGKADALADRRADEMERVQRAAQLAAAIAEAQRELAAVEREWGASNRSAERAQADWAAACATIGLPAAAGSAEARAFLAARSQVIEAARNLRRAEAEAAALGQRHTAWSARLADALGCGAGPLPALLGSARLMLQRAQADEKRRSEYGARLQQDQSSLRDHEAAFRDAAERLDQWSQEWGAALGRLGRPPGEHPDATGPVLDLLIRLEAEIAKTVELKSRAAKMTAQLSGFDADAAALAASLAEPGGDAITVVEAAMRRLERARAQHSRAETLRAQAETVRQGMHAAAAQERAASQVLDGVLQEAGSTDITLAEQRIALSSQRAVQAEARDAALRRLQEDGDGLSAAELRAQADAVPPDALAEQIAAAEAAMQEAQEDAQLAAAEEEGLRRDLQQLTENADVPQAAADVAAAQSRLGRVLEDALVHHTAATMLEDALQRVEASGDDPRLGRIGQAFAALTRGAYDRVSAGEISQPGKPPHRVLMAHEAGDAGEKQAGQLSEGTRDQLYLALRMVAIEDHVAAAPSLPFVADDILQTFDDGRAMAAFEALLRLSEHTQVIVLTHHEHLAALAETLPAGVRRIQRLPVA